MTVKAASTAPNGDVENNNSLTQKAKESNSFDKKTSKDFKNSSENDKNVDDGSRSALKKSDKEYRDEVKAKAEEKIAKATANAEAKSTECEQTKPSVRGAGMRHTNGRYKVRNEAQVM